ncbi:MAG: ATP-binding protein, partial [Lachnospiraceae bacterium]|nr:ATP-binding protein [Lachnospiraceae bacterium]
MHKFIGRKAELQTLENMYHSSGFQMVVIYGRRRIGKSTLIKEFIKDKRAVYYTATKTGISKNIELWGKQALETLAPEMNQLTFKNADDLLTFLGKNSEEERCIVVIDELPYLAAADKSILSVLQKMIDNQWINGQMFLILCGSSISFMENEVLSEKSPVFGRRTAQIRLEPFRYLEAAEFVPSYSYEEKAICFGITGGTAKYLSMLDDSKS